MDKLHARRDFFDIDLVIRLRARAEAMERYGTEGSGLLLLEAADEIERLRGVPTKKGKE